MARLQRTLTLACAALLLLVLAAGLLLPQGLESTKALCNLLFDASEAANAYVYTHFILSEDASPALAQGLCLAALTLLTGLAGLVPGAWLALGLALISAATQVYFGLSLPMWLNVAWFGALGSIVVWKQAGWRALLPFAAGLTCITLLTVMLWPGTDAAIERASEQIRDWFGAAYEQQLPSDARQDSELLETRHENRRALLDGDQTANADQTYTLLIMEEEQIALPHWIDYLRIALLCLLIPAALAVPFLPFIWLNKRSRLTAERLACLEAEDCTAAITGIFALIIGYLDACHVGDANALYIDRLNVPDDRLGDDYRTLYLQCVAIWQEAAYSGHSMTEAQRAPLLDLLAQTEHIFYDQADKKTQLQLRYVHCLHE